VSPVVAHAGAAGSLAPLAPLALAALLYARRAIGLRRVGRPVPPWRAACFAGGLGLVGLAVATPLGHVADELLAAHVLEHLLLAELGPVLLVLGLTGPLLAPALRRRTLARLRVLGHPAPALALWAMNLALWHLPALHEAAVRSAPIHAVQHALMLGLGAALWLPLFGPFPRPASLGPLGSGAYVLVIGVCGALLANVLLWTGGDLYDAYAQGRAEWGLAAAEDQATAGGLMLLSGSTLTLALVTWLVLRAVREAEERQGLLDLADARGVGLDERRAARAVAAGRAARLRARLAAGRTEER
jgi:putative membrane protein